MTCNNDSTGSERNSCMYIRDHHHIQIFHKFDIKFKINENLNEGPVRADVPMAMINCVNLDPSQQADALTPCVTKPSIAVKFGSN